MYFLFLFLIAPSIPLIAALNPRVGRIFVTIGLAIFINGLENLRNEDLKFQVT